jgi:hypothetical protein
MASISKFVFSDYCPRCGARKLVAAPYGNGHVVCRQCRVGFPNTPEGRWAAMKFPGTNARKVNPNTHRLSPGKFGQPHPRNARILRRVLGVVEGKRLDALSDAITATVKAIRESYESLTPEGAYAVRLRETVMPELPPGAALDIEVDVLALLRYCPEGLDPEALSRHIEDVFKQIQSAVARLKPGEIFVHADCIRVVGAFTISDHVNVIPQILCPKESA